MSSSGKTATHRVTPETTHLWGGALCLDFANTVDWSELDEPLAVDDVIRDPRDLMRWGRRLGVVRPTTPLIELPEFELLRALRLAVYRTMAAIARGQQPGADALRSLTAHHAAAAAAARLARGEEAWRLEWPARDPRRIRFAIVTDTVALLSDPTRIGRVRRCPGRGCGWLFLDVSGRRKWCSMTACGSREKMRRLYHRQHHGRDD
jgi:predicted RNA-binding Zn ribbon-like protein